MKILGLDLATSTGYAYNDDEDRFHCGTWLLATDGELKAARKQRLNRRLDPRVTNLFQQVQVLQTLHHFHVIVFEDVEFASYTLAVQLWASLRAAMWLGPSINDRPIFEAVPVGTLKKFATNHGVATKSMMVRALIKSDSRFSAHVDPEHAHFGRFEIDDNAVDAVWLWRWAKQNLGRMPI